MALDAAVLPYIRIVHPATDEEAYATVNQYRTIWFDEGWTSPVDDPTFNGDPDEPVEGMTLAVLRSSVEGLEALVGDAVDWDAELGDLYLKEATVDNTAGSVSGGVIRQAHSVLFDWTESRSKAPTDVALGTATNVSLDVTINTGGSGDFGPQFQTAHFGPRAIHNVEGPVRYGRNMTSFGFAPITFGDFLTLANTAGVARTLVPSWSFCSARSTIADGATVTLGPTDTNRGGAAFVDTPVFGTTDGGTLDGSSGTFAITSFFTQPGIVGNAHIYERFGLDVKGVITGIGAAVPSHWDGIGSFDADSVVLDREIGVRIQTFTLGTTKIGVLSAHPVVAPTFYGSEATGEHLTLGSTMHAAKGRIKLADTVELLSSDSTNTTTTSVRLMEVSSSRTVTLQDAAGGLNAGNAITGFWFAPTVVYEETSNIVFAGNALSDTATLKNAAGEARTIAGYQTVSANPTITADGATVTAASISGLTTSPVLSVANAGVLNMTDIHGVYSSVNVGTGVTVTNRKALVVIDAAGSGTVTTQIGVDVAALSKGATNIGIRNASTEVNTPSVATVTAVTDVIAPNARVKRVNNTSGGAITFTSAPTIADGVDGQLLTIFVSSGNAVTLSDQGTLASSNLRLSATTITLGTRDSITLMYSSTVGDWIQVAQVNVL